MKVNSIWITILDIKFKTAKLLEDKIEENLDDLQYDDDFQIQQKALSMKERIDKLDFINIKDFCPAKDTVRRMRL